MTVAAGSFRQHHPNEMTACRVRRTAAYGPLRPGAARRAGGWRRPAALRVLRRRTPLGSTGSRSRLARAPLLRLCVGRSRTSQRRRRRPRTRFRPARTASSAPPTARAGAGPLRSSASAVRPVLHHARYVRSFASRVRRVASAAPSPVPCTSTPFAGTRRLPPPRLCHTRRVAVTESIPPSRPPAPHMRWIPGRTFLMGSTTSTRRRRPSARCPSTGSGWTRPP